MEKLFTFAARKRKKHLFNVAETKQSFTTGALAQLVEQRTENPCVPGSIPGGTTKTNVKTAQKPAIQQIAGFFILPKWQNNASKCTLSGAI